MATLRQLFRRKPVPEMSAESGSDTGESELARSIGLFQLSMFGVGATIGTGIFFVLSQAVHVAGPAVIVSFVIAGAVAGLTAVTTAGEEVKDPRRTLPLAILIALVVVTTLHILVTAVAVAAQPYTQFEGQEAGLAAILQDVTGSTWPGTVLAAGAVISIFSVTLVVLYGQTRILFAMSRDGMLPELFHRVNPRTLTLVPNTIIVAVVIGLLAGLIPINFLAEMTSIGTLVAFLVVSIGVMVLRRTHPDLPRGFKVPFYPLTPILSIAGCLWIIQDLRAVRIWVFLIWVAIALGWYLLYGFRHSHVGRHEHVGLTHD
jgi:APA family basic amino acid/polyamine antiporter